MLKNMAMDTLGLSDIAAVIRPQDYNKVDSDDYVYMKRVKKSIF
ncbi:hypothetical protein [Trichormus azollae]|jgi:hypothetical protein|uniref:Uncharacterized protein n=1 Tax=Nostoc azollae (strain 0708) TaxID=551115 RepID=D7DW90_NOSA0|nr:hypothetical protein [Trichormus azollae]ADI64007.1 conserved hypothetical protein ['Nostoc azollae' 0708]